MAHGIFFLEHKKQVTGQYMMPHDRQQVNSRIKYYLKKMNEDDLV